VPSKISNCRYSSLSNVNLFQKNIALSEVHTKASKHSETSINSAYYTSVKKRQEHYNETTLSEVHNVGEGGGGRTPETFSTCGFDITLSVNRVYSLKQH
jgi:hypothetical protein